MAALCDVRPELTALNIANAVHLHDESIQTVCSLALSVLSIGSVSEDAQLTDRSLDAIARGLSSTLSSLSIVLVALLALYIP